MVDGSTRRLPSWMVANGDKNKTATAEPLSNCGTNNKKKVKNVVSRKGVGKKRKANDAVEDDDDMMVKDFVSSAQEDKKVGKKRGGKKTVEEDDELTVEDLVSIAQEYVRDHEEDLEPKQSLERKCSTTITPSSNGCKSDQQLPCAEIADSCSSTLNLTSQQSFIKVSTMGDPAQEMLHLFLGPLLKKPLEDETKSVFFRNDMDFPYDLGRQTQTDVGQELGPHTKKKSSLKDKVSSLLD
ncbi:hypothetical protein JCGZ_18589 [Jatropha curcas]|uniref:Uncharacterized protein n=1 Tax=Jatropha curcas TaxID=180498 RepID=A0A067K1K4_JATCU|nr:uncharacterized protein LOC105641409 [Jatropha curcas]KDP30017.1 hypothetical protein JCGZ_18589 [Jatropha curcas]